MCLYLLVIVGNARGTARFKGKLKGTIIETKPTGNLEEIPWKPLLRTEMSN